VNNGVQVGDVGLTTAITHAALWRGSAGTWLDLHQFVPSDFSTSFARDVWTDGTSIRVVGFGLNTTTQRYEALLWTYAPPTCPADFNNDGFLTFEDFDAFVVAFEAGEARSDFNNDGFLTFEDFDAFVAAFEAGC
jgi:hypothetical protein